MVTTISGVLLLQRSFRKLWIEDLNDPPVEGYSSLMEAGFPLPRESPGSPEEVLRWKQFRAQKMRAYLRLKNWSTPSLYFAACCENEAHLRKLRERRDDVWSMTILAGRGDPAAAKQLQKLNPANAYADVQWVQAGLARDAHDPEVSSLILMAAKKKGYASLKKDLEDELRVMHLEFFGDRRDAWIFAHEKGCALGESERDSSLSDALGQLLELERDPDRKCGIALALRKLSSKAEADGDLRGAQKLAWVIRDHLSEEELHCCMGLDRNKLTLWLDRLETSQRERCELPLAALRKANDDDLASMEVVHQYIGPNFAKHYLAERMARKKAGASLKPELAPSP